MLPSNFFSVTTIPLSIGEIPAEMHPEINQLRIPSNYAYTDTEEQTMEFQINALKFFAVIAVVALHFMNKYFTPDSVYQPHGHLLLVTNQFLRYCVPLFVMLSGYTLSRKYVDNKFQVIQFYARRVWKILPLYILWSYAIFLVLNYQNPLLLLQNFRWIRILIFGAADYHLYFVPMIFQLYILFPLLLWGVQRFHGLFVMGTWLLQFILYWFWSNQIEFTNGQYLSDQQQYLFFGTWWAYFVVGIYLNYIPKIKESLFFVINIFMVIVAFLWTIKDSWQLLASGLDLIVVTRFTKIPILFYATAFSILAIKYRQVLWKPVEHYQSALNFLGQQSFIIYLSHTLVLRFIFGLADRSISIEFASIILVGLCTTYVLSTRSFIKNI